MTDIVERLRQYVENIRGKDEPPENYLCGQAADEIERLRARVEALHSELAKARHGETVTRTVIYDSEAADEIERLRKLPDILAAEIERLRGIPDWKIGEGKPRDVRSDALEEAAKVADKYVNSTRSEDIAADIRALKGNADD